MHVLPSRMKSNFDGFDGVQLMGESAMRPPAPRSAHHTALLLLAGRRRPRHLALPCLALPCLALPRIPITAPAGVFKFRFQDKLPANFGDKPFEFAFP
jgi:hypothetical protein